MRNLWSKQPQLLGWYYCTENQERRTPQLHIVILRNSLSSYLSSRRPTELLFSLQLKRLRYALLRGFLNIISLYIYIFKISCRAFIHQSPVWVYILCKRHTHNSFFMCRIAVVIFFFCTESENDHTTATSISFSTNHLNKNSVYRYSVHITMLHRIARPPSFVPPYAQARLDSANPVNWHILYMSVCVCV